MNYDPNNILNSEETNFVKLSVYQSLEAENARLKAEVERLTNNCDYLDKKLDEELDKSAMLCGQVERLTKAGDAMAEEMGLETYAEEHFKQQKEFLKAWNAAKEGKKP